MKNCGARTPAGSLARRATALAMGAGLLLAAPSGSGATAAPNAVAAAPAAAAATSVESSSSAPLRVTGRVEDDLLTLVTPAIAMPTPSLDAGFATATATTATTTATATKTTTALTGAALTGLGSHQRVTYAARQGSLVAAGQVLVTFERTALTAALQAARADATVARTRVDVLDHALDQAADARSTLRSNRATIDDTIGTLTTTRAGLLAKLAQLRKLLASLPPRPPTLPPGVPKPPTRAQVQALIAQVRAALARLDAGLAAARNGLARIDAGLDTLAQTRTTLTGLRRLARTGVRAADLSAQATALTRTQAEVRAPEAGRVVTSSTAGDVLPVGARVLVLRRTTAPVRVTTWLSPAQLARTCRGAAATVAGDWMPPGQSVPARVSAIGDRAQYPPTRQATDEVHLSRTIKVTVTSTMANTTALPPGVPVDLELHPCPAAAGRSLTTSSGK